MTAVQVNARFLAEIVPRPNNRRFADAGLEGRTRPDAVISPDRCPDTGDNLLRPATQAHLVEFCRIQFVDRTIKTDVEILGSDSVEDLAGNEARRRSAHAERLLDGSDRQVLGKWHELKWRRRAIAQPSGPTSSALARPLGRPRFVAADSNKSRRRQN